jgi:hypothetical protein
VTPAATTTVTKQGRWLAVDQQVGGIRATAKLTGTSGSRHDAWLPSDPADAAAFARAGRRHLKAVVAEARRRAALWSAGSHARVIRPLSHAWKQQREFQQCFLKSIQPLLEKAAA